MSLENLRKKIDQLDVGLLRVLAQRLEISKEIAEFKKANHLPVQDRKRELELIIDRIKKGKELGVDDQKFVTELFELIMKKSREVQQ
jgi:chorismate mutase